MPVRESIGERLTIEVGDRVQFVPPYMPDDRYNKKGCDACNEPVEGKVFLVNGNGVIFVVYHVNGVALRISFLLSDIGRNLKILK